MFPDQYHDAIAASRAFLSTEVLEHYSIDPERVCVSGDSAGGNLAAAVAQKVEKQMHTEKEKQFWGSLLLFLLSVYAEYTRFCLFIS